MQNQLKLMYVLTEIQMIKDSSDTDRDRQADKDTESGMQSDETLTADMQADGQRLLRHVRQPSTQMKNLIISANVYSQKDKTKIL